MSVERYLCVRCHYDFRLPLAHTPDGELRCRKCWAAVFPGMAYPLGEEDEWGVLAMTGELFEALRALAAGELSPDSLPPSVLLCTYTAEDIARMWRAQLTAQPLIGVDLAQPGTERTVFHRLALVLEYPPLPMEGAAAQSTLPGYLCEQCLDAPAVQLQPAPWGGEMGACSQCKTPA